MDRTLQKREVEGNYDVFVRSLGRILAKHRGQFALMRHGEIIGFFDRPGAANVAAHEKYPDGLYSIQEVTDEPIDLGFWSNVATN